MTSTFSKRFWQVGLGLLGALLLAGLWQTAAAAKTPAQVRVAQFIPDTELTMQWQPQSGDRDAVTQSDLTYTQLSDYQSLPAGRYTLTVQKGDHVLLRSTYGLGAGDRYTLALFGLLPTQPTTNPRTWMAQLKRILGGSDAHAVNGYLAQMTLLHDQVSHQTDAPQVRFVHLAPGIVPMRMAIQSADTPMVSKQLAYPEASAATAIEGELSEPTITIYQGQAAIASQSVNLDPQTLTDIFVVGGLDAPQSVALVVADAVTNR